VHLTGYWGDPLSSLCVSVGGVIDEASFFLLYALHMSSVAWCDVAGRLGEEGQSRRCSSRKVQCSLRSAPEDL